MRSKAGFGIIVAAVGLAAAGAASAQMQSMTGVWRVNGSVSVAGRAETVTPVCTFQQSGTALSGECVGPNARGPIHGSINGARVSWTWSHTATTAIGVTGATNFNGTMVSSRLIRGAMTAPPLPGSGSFTQTR